MNLLLKEKTLIDKIDGTLLSSRPNSIEFLKRTSSDPLLGDWRMIADWDAIQLVKHRPPAPPGTYDCILLDWRGEGAAPDIAQCAGLVLCPRCGSKRLNEFCAADLQTEVPCGGSCGNRFILMNERVALNGKNYHMLSANSSDFRSQSYWPEVPMLVLLRVESDLPQSEHQIHKNIEERNTTDSEFTLVVEASSSVEELKRLKAAGVNLDAAEPNGEWH